MEYIDSPHYYKIGEYDADGIAKHIMDVFSDSDVKLNIIVTIDNKFEVEFIINNDVFLNLNTKTVATFDSKDIGILYSGMWSRNENAKSILSIVYERDEFGIDKYVAYEIIHTSMLDKYHNVSVEEEI